MYKKVTSKIPISILLLVYFYLCGGLYLIGFWGIFDIDISNLISITDIPKSFVFPFFVTQGLLVLQSFINFITSSYLEYDDIKENGNEEKKTKEKISNKRKLLNWLFRILKKTFSVLTSLNMIIILVSYLIFTNYKNNQTSILFWVCSSLIMSHLLVTKFVRWDIAKEYIKSYNTRYFIAFILISMPIYCFSTGKISSLSIYNNDNIKIVKSSNIDNKTFPCNDSIQYKFIGFIGDKFIISSIDNKNLHILRQSSYDRISLKIKDNKVPKINKEFEFHWIL